MSARWRPAISGALQSALNYRLQRDRLGLLGRGLDLREAQFKESQKRDREAREESRMQWEEAERARTGKAVQGMSAHESKALMGDLGSERAFHRDTSDEAQEGMRKGDVGGMQRVFGTTPRPKAPPPPQAEDPDSLFASLMGVNTQGFSAEPTDSLEGLELRTDVARGVSPPAQRPAHPLAQTPQAMAEWDEWDRLMATFKDRQPEAPAPTADPARDRMEASRAENMRLLEERRKARAAAGLGEQPMTAFEENQPAAIQVPEGFFDEEEPAAIQVPEGFFDEEEPAAIQVPEGFFDEEDEDVDIDAAAGGVSRKAFAEGDVIEGRAPRQPEPEPEPPPPARRKGDLDWLPFQRMSKEEAAAAAERAYANLPRAASTIIDAEAGNLADLMRGGVGDDQDTLLNRAKAYLASTLVKDTGHQGMVKDRYGRGAISQDTMEAGDKAAVTAPFRPTRASRTGRTPEQEAAFRRKTETMEGLALNYAVGGDARAGARLRRMMRDVGSYDGSKVIDSISKLGAQQDRALPPKIDRSAIERARDLELELLDAKYKRRGRPVRPEDLPAYEAERRRIEAKYNAQLRGTVQRPSGGAGLAAGSVGLAEVRAEAERLGHSADDFNQTLNAEQKLGPGHVERVRLLLRLQQRQKAGKNIDRGLEKLRQMRERAQRIQRGAAR